MPDDADTQTSATSALALDRPMTEAMLARLGLAAPPSHDMAGLTTLYTAWLQNVPFCSSQKRCHYGADVNRPGPLPVMTAPSYVAAYLEHGTGGTYFPTAEAFFQLLSACGFSARRALGSMLDFPQIPGPNHGTVIVTLDGLDYLVDPFFGSEQPLPLDGAAHSVGRPSLELRSEPAESGGSPLIFWRFHNARQWMQFGFDRKYPDVTQAHFAARYEASGGANSVFNASLYISRHHGQAVHTIFKNEYFILSPDNAIHREPVADRRNELLVDVFGLSVDMAKNIPEDLAA